MESQHGSRNGFPELGMGDFLRELWGKKYVLGAVTLLTGITMAFYSLSLPNVYESSSALIVRHPRNASPGAEEAPAMSVETLRALTESMETLWALFDALWERQALERWAVNKPDRMEAFLNFRGGVDTRLLETHSRSRGDAVDLLPVLELTARAASPEEAQIIANEWAAIVEAKSREIFTEGVGTLDDYVGTMYDRANQDLILSETEYAQARLEATLDLKNLRLNALKDRLTALEVNILDIEVEIAINEATILDGSERLAEQYYGPDWIGSVVEAALMQGEELPFEEAGFSERARRIVELTRQKVAQIEGLRELSRREDIFHKENQYSHYQSYADRLLADIAALKDQLPASEELIASLARLREDIPEKLVLEKAITDDALWNAHVAGKTGNAALATPLQSELINPLHQSVTQMIVDTTAQMEKARASLVHLEQQYLDNNAKMLGLHLELDAYQQERDRREMDQGTTHALLQMFREELVAENKKIEELRVTNLRRMEEKRVSERLRGQFEAEVRLLEEDISRAQLDLEVRNRDVEKTLNVRNALAARAEGTALLRVSAESAARTGTAILYQAQPDPQKVGPRRSVMTLAGMMGALVLSVALVCMARVVRETD